jgi:hypothetical protein
MPIRTTFDLPEQLHEVLLDRSHKSKKSMRSLIVDAVAEKYGTPKGKIMLTGPILKGKGRPGPRFPVDKTPYDLLLP